MGSQIIPLATTTLLLMLAIIMPSCTTMAYNNILYSGETLYAGQSLDWGSYILTMQSDCNLVLYDRGYPVWATNTGGRSSGCRLVMQTDGNLVVYDQYNTVIWASNSYGAGGYYVLVLQKDRNVVVYGTSRWASASNAAGVTINALDSSNKTAADEGAVMVN